MSRCVLLVALLLAGAAFAGEQEVAGSAVPKAVLDGVARLHPTGKRLGFERETAKGKTTYEVRLDVDGRKIDVDVAADGRILEEEEEIGLASAPEAVRQALAASPTFGAWTVQRAEKITKANGPEAPVYELLLTHERARAEVLFAADGRLLQRRSLSPK
jgi:hypothetical protein